MTIRTRNERSIPRWLTACLGMTLLLSGAVTLAQEDNTVMRVERLQVEHRDPSTLRENLLPLLSGRESIGVIGDWLIVAATDATRSRIRQQLESLDTPVRRLDVTLSFAAPADAADAGGDSAAGPSGTERELTLEPGQTVRLDLPAGDDAGGEETPRQISLRVVISGWQWFLEYAVHPADEPVDPSTGTRQALRRDDWQSLSDAIDIRVRPQY